MNKKSMIIFVLWVGFCISLLVFMFVYLAVQQIEANQGEELMMKLISLRGARK